ncbi:DUF2800 domain-containing protein [Cysteiniphilum halobium]|uniref:DUF2800 domain-containing protein n=1 Tax=Cysteiniphilum halobium TaxID=2219059 RepID=UPI003F875CD3
MKQHAPLSASAAHRWVNCTASYQMTKDLPDSTSIYAERGSALHDLAYSMLIDDPTKSNLTFAECAEDEAVAVKSYVDYVSDAEAEHYYLETKVDFSHIVPEGFGTADAILITPDKLTIVDLKTGKGVPVSATENEQLMLYALGALNTYRDQTLFVQIIECVVHQDIIGNVNSWSVSIDELQTYAQKFKTAAKEAFDLTQHNFNPSTSVCKFCAAKGSCKAYAQYATDMVVEGFQNLTLDPYTLTNDEIVQVLGKADAFQNWIEAVKEHAKDKLLNNEHLNGYSLAVGRKSRSWTDEKILEQFLKQKRIPLSIYKPRKLASVAQLEKKLKHKKLDLNEFIAVSSGAPRIVKDSSNSEAHQNDVLKGFEKIA